MFTAVVMAGDAGCAQKLKNSGCDKVISICSEKLAEHNPAYYAAGVSEEQLEAMNKELVKANL